MVNKINITIIVIPLPLIFSINMIYSELSGFVKKIDLSESKAIT